MDESKTRLKANDDLWFSILVCEYFQTGSALKVNMYEEKIP